MRRVVLALTAAAALSGAGIAAAADVVNVYSARQEALIKPLLDRFTEETGVRVRLVTGSADALIQRLQAEGRNTPADVLITVDAGRLHRALTANLLQPVDSAILREAVPEHLREPDGYWFGLSKRARVIMYDPERVDPFELSTYEDLADEKWRGRICIRSSGNIYNQSLLAAMIAAHDEERASDWAAGMVENMARPPQGGDRDQIRAVAAGQCDLAVANTYYYGGMLAEAPGSDDREVAERVELFFPNQNDRGTHVNVSGAGVVRHADNVDHAVRLIEYLVSESSQRWYAEANHEYPVRSGLNPAGGSYEWSPAFREDGLALGTLGDLNPAAIRIFDRVGWH